MTSKANKEFIEKLRKAKKLALEKYTDDFRILDACGAVGWGWKHNCTFGKGTKYDSTSGMFLREQGNTPENVASVFDESIRALGGKP